MFKKICFLGKHITQLLFNQVLIVILAFILVILSLALKLVLLESLFVPLSNNVTFVRITFFECITGHLNAVTYQVTTVTHYSKHKVPDFFFDK